MALAQRRPVNSAKASCELAIAITDMTQPVVDEAVERGVADEGVGHELARGGGEEAAEAGRRIGCEILLEDSGGGSGGGRGRETVEATHRGDRSECGSSNVVANNHVGDRVRRRDAGKGGRETDLSERRDAEQRSFQSRHVVDERHGYLSGADED
jgi:hypothetical protein